MNLLGSDSVRKGCLMGIASIGHNCWRFTESLVTDARPMNYAYGYMWVVGRSLTDAYNILMHYAKLNGYEYLFLREEDTIAPPDAWTKMVNKMERNPEITAITGIYPRKGGGDPTPFIYRGNLHGPYIDWKWGEFFEVTGIPFGCTLIRVADLEKLDPFTDDVEIPSYPEAGINLTAKAYCKMQVESVASDGTRVFLESQDIFFSELCQKAGLKLYADASVHCGHYDINAQVEYRIPEYLHSGWKPPEGKTAINVGAGAEFGLVHNVKPLRVDWREEYRPDFRGDPRDLSGITEQFDYVRCPNVLQRFTDEDAERIVNELVRLCKPGGEIHLVVPNVTRNLEILNEGKDQPLTWWNIYGQHNDYKSGYTTYKLARLLTKCGVPMGGMMERDYELEGRILCRAFKEPVPPFVSGWRHLDKEGWSEAAFFDSDTKAIKIGGQYIPMDASIPQENVDAYFTPEEQRAADERIFMPQVAIADRLHALDDESNGHAEAEKEAVSE